MKKILLTFVSLLTMFGASAQTFTVEPANYDSSTRDFKFILSGDWANGASLQSEISRLMDVLKVVPVVTDGNTPARSLNGANVTVTGVTTGTKTDTILVCKDLIQQLTTGKKEQDGSFTRVNINKLDLGGVCVDGYVGHANNNADANATFGCDPNSNQIAIIRELIMPQFNPLTASQHHYSIPAYTFTLMGCVEKLTLPLNTDKLEPCAFAGNDLTYFKLNQGLRFIGNSAFYATNIRNKTATLDIPSTVKYIGPGAFNFWVFTDMYFHTAQAPICPFGKCFVVPTEGEKTFIYDICYDGNGGFTDTTPGADKYREGYANRQNYNKGVNSYWFLMIHYPSSTELPDMDFNTYQDATRVYHKVYGSVYYSQDPDNEGKLVIGVEGDESTQKFGDKDRIWDEANSRDWVGKETTALSYQGKSTLIDNGEAYVNSGFEDTYRGLNYIWPCQSQYIRAYVTVNNGYQWDGVTPYRPTLSQEQINLMIEDGLEVKINDNWVKISNDDVLTLTADEAIMYNTKLPGAKKEGDVKSIYEDNDADNAAIVAYNKTLSGAVVAGTNYYSQSEVDAHNATLTGAVKEGDKKMLSFDEYVAAGLLNDPNYNWIRQQGETKYNEQVQLYLKGSTWALPNPPYVLYTAATASAYNANLAGAWSTLTVKGTYTEAQAVAYNAALPGAVKVGDPKEYYTKTTANDYNLANVQGAVQPGANVNGNYNNATVADHLSKVAYMSTRSCVFGANDGRSGEDYPVPVKGQNWWTICLPFDLTKAQIDKYFGVGTHVCLFNKVDRKIDTQNPSESMVKFYFTDDQYVGKTDNEVVLKAHTAYMIFPKLGSQDATTFKISSDDYTIVPGNPSATVVKANDGTEYRFVGNYDTKVNVEKQGHIVEEAVTIPQYSYFYAKKKSQTGHAYKFWFIQNSNIKWEANKCVIQATERDGGLLDNKTFFSNNSAQAKQISVFGDWCSEDEETAIQNVIFVVGSGDNTETIYNLNGQQIREADTRGIFIKNGKKYLNR